MLIDGEVIASTNVLEVRNPYNLSVACVPVASKDEVRRALELAWRTKSPLTKDERISFLKNIAAELHKKRSYFASLIAFETGLSFSKDAYHEVDRAIATAHATAAVAERMEKEWIEIEPTLSAKSLLRVMSEPVSLVVGITPFNHPLNLVCHDVLPAIAAGASMVLKPSPKTPLTARAFGEMLHELGLPKNLLNIVVDDGTPAGIAEIGHELVMFPGTELVLFTGSVTAGFSLARQVAQRYNPLIRYIPELGGCAPFIVCEDADLNLASELALKGCFDHSGQRCTAIRKIIVMECVANAFIKRFVDLVKNFRFGDPYNHATQMGTVISPQAAATIKQRVDSAIKDGAKLLLGNVINPEHPALFAPTVLDRVTRDMSLLVNETFGPVAPIIRVKNLEEAIEAGRSDLMLAAAAITKDKATAIRIAKALGFGQFSWNGVPGYRTEEAPFGGFGSSGNGAKRGVWETTQAMRKILTFYEH